MTWEAMTGLAVATFIFALIPGPGIAAVVAHALGRGFGPAARFCSGLVLGDMIYLVMAMFGMGWVASQLGDFFLILKWLGAAYLVYLGVQCWLDSSVPATDSACTRSSKSFWGGLCITLGNPKVIAFYCGFLPGFVHMDQLTTMDMIAVVSITCPIVFLVPLGYAWGAARTGSAARSTTLYKTTKRTAGTVMIGAGLAVAVD